MKNKVKKVIKILKEKYGEPEVTLNYNNPFELLIAVILSAQCTDKRVNIVTKELFKVCNSPSDFVKISQDELERLIKSTGFYKNKSKNIKKCAKQIIKSYDGKVPDTREKLVKLAGVGRKTANVVLGHIFNKPAIPVDTHVKRLSRLIGLTKANTPEKIEQDLMEITAKKDWFLLSNLLITHGRNICKARRPNCKECCIRKYCNYGGENDKQVI
ncbi:MAG: endonuclease III [Fusobacteriia bacterium 4572_132]|nr:MAG: endonuclease III [Fusobacteriia bacterium 4572_132]